MRRLQLAYLGSVLFLMCSCSTPARPPEEQSILELLDSAKTTPALHGCSVGEVSYCLVGPSQLEQCTCLDSRETMREFGTWYGARSE